jgi:hypothetical protein
MDDLPWWDLRRVPIPEDVERDIVTPHSHEHPEKNKPLWLVWALDHGDFPRLDSVADTEDSARYHYRAAVQSGRAARVHVERVPANHRFASSLGEWQIEAHQALWKERAARNKREGD